MLQIKSSNHKFGSIPVGNLYLEHAPLTKMDGVRVCLIWVSYSSVYNY